MALTRRTPLRRGRPLRSRKPIARRTRIKPRNAKRAATRFERAYHSDAFCAWVRSLGCSIGGCGSHQIEVAHAVSRGAGGIWKETLPLCARHHFIQHVMGVRSFEQAHGIVLVDVAAAVHLRWRAFARGAD